MQDKLEQAKTIVVQLREERSQLVENEANAKVQLTAAEVSYQLQCVFLSLVTDCSRFLASFRANYNKFLKNYPNLKRLM